ncbi:hypothetical protein KC19_8G022100 [Ceratodon purpureus]|uniref:Secreted protein n=1 Tax=Ceratodon purpureus TaxID=3225 RepID=A0A8T0GXP5_CERPU|nr:hypothetical protein KC19_8G022100 [Ceratodon purpureus]
MLICGSWVVNSRISMHICCLDSVLSLKVCCTVCSMDDASVARCFCQPIKEVWVFESEHSPVLESLVQIVGAIL